jgi:hypothetical protein
MNQRIHELHKQAQQAAFNEPIDIENCKVEDIKGFSQQVYEKFAELIIKECGDIAYKSGSVHNKNIHAKMESDRIYHKIKEHFGVQE